MPRDMRVRRRVRTALSVVAAGLFLAWITAMPQRVQAQQQPEVPSVVDRNDLEARRRFEAGRLAFEAGRFEDALGDFRSAYELSRRPDLLYNIGQAADRLRRDREALDAFERYLRDAGAEAAARAEVEARVRVLRAAIDEDERDGPREAPAVAAALPDSRPTTSDDSTPWLVVGAGGVVAAAGAVLLGVGLADRASVEGAQDGASWPVLREAADRAPLLEGAGAAALGVGVAAVAGAIVWAVADASGASDAVAACGVGACVRF